jgi:hypothetical protein
MNVVEAHDDYFVHKRDAAGVLGLSSFQKVIAALRMLTYVQMSMFALAKALHLRAYVGSLLQL